MPIFQLVLFFVVFAEALAQNCQGCETFLAEKSIIESDGKSYVLMYTNTTTVNGCKAVMLKCVVFDRSAECETTALYWDRYSSKIVHRFTTTDDTHDTSYSDILMCAQIPGSTRYGYVYNGQEVKIGCLNRCTSGGGPPAESWTPKPDPTKNETTTVEPKPVRHAGGCRARRP